MSHHAAPARSNPPRPTAAEPRHEFTVPAEAAANAQTNVGQRLHELRTGRGLSLRALAEQSALNVNTLSLIENDKTSPSVSTLQQIAAALEVPIVAFFETDQPRHSVAHLVAGRRLRAAFAQGTVEDLGAGLTQRGVEPFVVTLDPNADSGPQPIVHTGFEFVFCLQGQLAYQIDGHLYPLEPGDSLLFEAHLPHHWRNPTDQPAQAILVLYTTDVRDQPTERHFSITESRYRA
jgi:transcriptional regulator with XRE-family HTH domain